MGRKGNNLVFALTNYSYWKPISFPSGMYSSRITWNKKIKGNNMIGRQKINWIIQKPILASVLISTPSLPVYFKNEEYITKNIPSVDCKIYSTQTHVI